MIDKLIYPNHSSFLRGQLLVDRMMTVNEFVDFAKKTKKGCIILKVNFLKTYDSIS